MKNLENYGVQELSATEIVDVDGGFFIVALVIILVVGTSIPAY